MKSQKGMGYAPIGDVVIPIINTNDSIAFGAAEPLTKKVLFAGAKLSANRRGKTLKEIADENQGRNPRIMGMSVKHDLEFALTGSQVLAHKLREFEQQTIVRFTSENREIYTTMLSEFMPYEWVWNATAWTKVYKEWATDYQGFLIDGGIPIPEGGNFSVEFDFPDQFTTIADGSITTYYGTASASVKGFTLDTNLLIEVNA